MKTLVAKTVGRWRKWLDEHHDSESEVWLIFHKLHTGARSIAYSDALDEALCFGWVDSLVKRLDDSRYARKFTPRKAESQAGGDEGQALAGGDSPPCCRQAAGTQVSMFCAFA